MHLEARKRSRTTQDGGEKEQRPGLLLGQPRESQFRPIRLLTFTFHLFIVHSVQQFSSERDGFMKLGIVGLPRSGKTTIFNALTHRGGKSEAATGQAAPVLGVVPLPDPRVDWLSHLYQPKKTTHAQVTYLDLQGLPGMIESKQEYMSLLLNHMRPMDAFLMVVRNFPDASLGAPQPGRDFRELADELLIADLGTIEKRIEKLTSERKRGKKIPDGEWQILHDCAAWLNEERPLRLRPDLAEAPELRGFTLLSAKPLLVIVNNSDDDDALPQGVFESVEAMMVRGRLEMEMAQLSDEDAAAFRADFGITETALDRVIQHSFSLLHLATFLTVGDDEVKAWTIPESLPALEAAGAVHSDIQRGFIRAEVVAFDDLKRAGDYAAARKMGLVRLEGKTYPVKDGDIIHFRFNI